MVEPFKYEALKKYSKAIVLVLSDESIKKLNEEIKNNPRRYEVEFSSVHDGTGNTPFFISGLCGYDCNENNIVISEGVEINHGYIYEFITDYNLNKRPQDKMNTATDYIVYKNGKKIGKDKIDNIDIIDVLRNIQYLESESLYYKCVKINNFFSKNKDNLKNLLVLLFNKE